MASIIKRRTKYAVVYYVIDENGKQRQKWESFDTRELAKKRKNEIEHAQDVGTFIVPSAKTVRELLKDFVEMYGVNTWAPATYCRQVGLINNYVLPILGDMKITDVTTRTLEKYYQKLLTMPAKPAGKNRQAGNIGGRTVQEIHKMLRCAFEQAIKWDLLERNPASKCTVPRCETKAREIWDTETIAEAIDACEDPLLALCINLAFSCSLRMGEMLGLTWDCVDITEESIRNHTAHIFVNKEQQRISRSAMDALSARDVIFRYPAVYPRCSTVLVLKPPKTASSVRKVYLPTTVAELLVERKKEIDGLKDIFGDEYSDYNLVICTPNGRPIEGSRINRMMCELIKKNDLPKVVFHSLRHSSTTYKLKLSGGDIKCVQGDTGHAQATMVTDRYAHIMDEDRRVNTERFEEMFYGRKPAAKEKPIKPAKQETEVIETEKLVEFLQQSPELMKMLQSMIRTKQ